MDPKLLKQAAAEFVALDFSAENARITEINEEIARLASAQDSARTRCREIDLTLADYRGPDARAVADALIAGQTAMEAAKSAPNELELKEERGALMAAMKTLGHQIQDAQSQIDSIRTQAFGKVSEMARTIVDSLMEDARQAAEELLCVHAALNAVHVATRCGANELSATSTAIGELVGSNRLLTGRRHIPVPEEITDMLQGLSGKGAALPAGMLTSCALY